VSLGPLVDAAWLVDNLSGVVVVDVRWSVADGPARAAYDAAHIPGAVFADLDADLAAPASAGAGRHPLPTPEAFAVAMGSLGVGDSSPVVAYDDVGGIIAARLWWMLDAIGREAAVFDGGIQAWTGELSSKEVVVEPAVFTPTRWPADRLMSADELEASLGTDLVILDGRSAERYAHGASFDPRPGHVPGARSAPATDNLDYGRWRSADDLLARYEALGATTAEVAAYCGSGVTACADLLGRRRAGLPDGRLFVGSWSQWGADAARPITEGADP
jgi:thiosulfate/3-mercaptopyruvate sulfurtransferase